MPVLRIATCGVNEEWRHAISCGVGLFAAVSRKGDIVSIAGVRKALGACSGERSYFLKFFGVLLLIACVETGVYWLFSLTPERGQGEVSALSPEEAQEYLRDTPDLLVVDVRSRKEFADGHLAHAVNIPLYAFQHMVKSIPSNAPILLHCQYGYRALQAYKLLRRLRPDLQNVRYVAGQLAFSFLR